MASSNQSQIDEIIVQDTTVKVFHKTLGNSIFEVQKIKGKWEIMNISSNKNLLQSIKSKEIYVEGKKVVPSSSQFIEYNTFSLGIKEYVFNKKNFFVPLKNISNLMVKDSVYNEQTLMKTLKTITSLYDNNFKLKHPKGGIYYR